MENASKALIIAGAILISIVLVTVGVIVVNSLNPDDALSSMTQQEMQTFNSKFEGSAETSVQGSKVRSLISTVITNNATYSDGQEKFVTIKSGSTDYKTADALSKLRNSINNNHKYSVTLTYTNGLVSTITITDNNS